jgi:hypothetical protein
MAFVAAQRRRDKGANQKSAGAEMRQQKAIREGHLRGCLSAAKRTASSTSRLLLLSVAVLALSAQIPGAARAQSLPSGEAVADANLLPPPPAAAADVRAHRPHVAMPAAKPQSDITPAPPQDSHRWGSKDWLLERRTILGDAPDMVRYVANECILAGVAGAAIAVALTVSGGAVGPVATAALGVSPEMSTFGITALGCVAGAAAGVASAVAIYAYEEPETIRDFAVEQAGNVRYAATVTAEAVAGAVRAPQDLMYAAASGAWNVAATAASGAQWAAASAASGAQWAASSAASGAWNVAATAASGAQWAAASAASGVGYAVAAVAGGAQAKAGAAMTAAVEGVGIWWAGSSPYPAPEVTFDVASVPSSVGGQARVY